jgi:hypothetical protein
VLSRSRSPQAEHAGAAAGKAPQAQCHRLVRSPLYWLVLLALVLTACQGNAAPAADSAKGGGVLRVGTPFLS